MGGREIIEQREKDDGRLCWSHRRNLLLRSRRGLTDLLQRHPQLAEGLREREAVRVGGADGGKEEAAVQQHARVRHLVLGCGVFALADGQKHLLQLRRLNPGVGEDGEEQLATLHTARRPEQLSHVGEAPAAQAAALRPAATASRASSRRRGAAGVIAAAALGRVACRRLLPAAAKGRVGRARAGGLAARLGGVDRSGEQLARRRRTTAAAAAMTSLWRRRLHDLRLVVAPRGRAHGPRVLGAQGRKPRGHGPGGLGGFHHGHQVRRELVVAAAPAATTRALQRRQARAGAGRHSRQVTPGRHHWQAAGKPPASRTGRDGRAVVRPPAAAAGGGLHVNFLQLHGAQPPVVHVHRHEAAVHGLLVVQLARHPILGRPLALPHARAGADHRRVRHKLRRERRGVRRGWGGGPSASGRRPSGRGESEQQSFAVVGLRGGGQNVGWGEGVPRAVGGRPRCSWSLLKNMERASRGRSGVH